LALAGARTVCPWCPCLLSGVHARVCVSVQACMGCDSAVWACVPPLPPRAALCVRAQVCDIIAFNSSVLNGTAIPPWGTTICEYISVATARFVNANYTATYVFLPISTNPDSLDGKRWLRDARAVQAQLSAQFPSLRVSLAMGASEDLDAVSSVYGSFPIMIGITTAFILSLIAMYAGTGTGSWARRAHPLFHVCTPREGCRGSACVRVGLQPPRTACCRAPVLVDPPPRM
jgi:hypothetical protein